MAEYIIQEETLTGIADAIRIKTGSENVIKAGEMAEAISQIHNDATATSNQILAGYKAYGANVIEGSMINNGDVNTAIENGILKAGYTSGGSIANSGYININGSLNTGVVSTGQSINAGDFVSYIAGSWGNDTRVNYSYGAMCTNSDMLTDGRIIVPMLPGKLCLITKNGNSFTTTEISGIFSNSGTTQYSYGLCIALPNNKVIVTCDSYDSSTYQEATHLALYQINGNTASLLNSTTFNPIGYSGWGACKVTDNRIIFYDRYTYQPGVYICGVVDNTISIINAGTFRLGQGSNYPNIGNVTALNENTLIVGFGNGYKGCCCILKINGTSFTVSSQITLYTDSDTDNSSNSPFFVPLKGNKIFTIIPTVHDGSGNGSIYASILEYDNNYNITVGTPKYFFNGTCGQPIKFNSNKILLPYGTYRYSDVRFAAFNIDNSYNITKVEDLVLNDTDYSNNGRYMFLANDTSIIYLHNYDSSLYCIIKSSDSFYPYNGTIYGVAKDSGSNGDVIEVYKPN